VLLGAAALQFTERLLASSPQSLVVFVNLVTDLRRDLCGVFDLNTSRVGQSLQCSRMAVGMTITDSRGGR